MQAVFEELVSMVDGGEAPELKKGRPNVVMFVGLQGKLDVLRYGLQSGGFARCNWSMDEVHQLSLPFLITSRCW